MTVPADGKFVFTPTPKDGETEPHTISVPSLGDIPRSYGMIEAAADGQDARFIVQALRNVGDPEMVLALRDLVPADWERFLVEWRTFSRLSVGE